MTEKIRIGHSPDSDDAFMFYALAENLIPTDGIEVEHLIEDIESLNKRAVNAELEVTAISIHAYAYVAQNYVLMPCGASIGNRYGPVVVSNEPLDRDELAGKVVAIPGEMTTAYLTLRLFQPNFKAQVVPFDQILEHVKAGKSDAGLVIHEGQLTYENRGFHKVVDLGEWWHDETGLPLPLGANAIKRNLGVEKITKVSKLLKKSIQYALDHREKGLEFAETYARELADYPDLTDRFVGMYVNEHTLDYGDDGRKAVQLLLDRGYDAGLIKSKIKADFAGI